jgi:hypothetical protein
LRCVDDLIFDEIKLCQFLNSKKEDYMGNLDKYGEMENLVHYENISRRWDDFIPHYFIGHQEEIIHPLNGLENYGHILNTLTTVPNCRYINGVITWLSNKSCKVLEEEIKNPEWSTFQHFEKYGFPYIIEDVGIGFILAKSNIYPINKPFYKNQSPNNLRDYLFNIQNGIDIVDNTFAIHTNDFK